MSKFTKTVTKDFKVDGDDVKVTFNRMKTSDFKLMSTHMELGKDGMPTGKISFTNQMDMLTKAIEILPNRVESMEGLKDDQGNELSFAEIVGEQYFLGFVGELFGVVMESSIISDGKKSGETSGDASTK